jgi:hypothetical protein
VKEQHMNPRLGWSQPPTGWGQPTLPGWAPLVDAGPGSLQAARSVGRWLWPTLAVAGFLALTGFIVRHDDPTPGLSHRGLLTITLAAAVVILLTIRRTAGPGPLARALVEYAIVFVLAVLIATTGIPADQPPTAGKTASTTADQRPALVKTIDGFRDWLSEWRQWARKQNDHSGQCSPTIPAPTLSPSTRRPL